MAELLAGLDNALAGHTQFFLLAGEAGIGKTRIANEVASHAETRGTRVVWGWCWEGNGAPAHWTLIQVARALIDQSGPGAILSTLGAGAHDLARLIGVQSPDGVARHETEGDRARFRLFDSFAALLRNSARSEPLLVVLDDLHCSGQAAWSMVQFIARELRDAPLMMIITCRDGKIQQSPRFAKVAGDLLRSARQLSLKGLSEDEVAQFVESSSGHIPSPALAGTLHRRTAGNPFFLSEVVRALMAHGDLTQANRNARWELTIPDSVRTSIRGRIALLPPHARRVLSVAAVIGSRFELAPVQRACELPNEQLLRILDAAVNAGIVARLAGTPAAYRFCHALVQKVLYEGLETGERLRLHQTFVGPSWVERATAMRQRRGVATSAVPSADVLAGAIQTQRPDDAPGTVEAVFFREGDYFTISFNDSLIRLARTKGLRYVAYLLARPGQRIPADELARIINGSRATGRASVSDKRRAHSEESRAVERSRVMVTKGIKAAIARIRGANPLLGRRFAITIRTGRACIYEPDPEHPISWRVRE